MFHVFFYHDIMTISAPNNNTLPTLDKQKMRLYENDKSVLSMDLTYMYYYIDGDDYVTKNNMQVFVSTLMFAILVYNDFLLVGDLTCEDILYEMVDNSKHYKIMNSINDERIDKYEVCEFVNTLI